MSLDACSIIYFLESKQEQGIGTRRFINDALKNNALLQVSRLSFLECRYMPLKEKNFDLLAEYDQFFLFDCLQIIELSSEVVNLATQLKANYPQSLRTPDALQVASAIVGSSEILLTGDKRLANIKEINVKII